MGCESMTTTCPLQLRTVFALALCLACWHNSAAAAAKLEAIVFILAGGKDY